MRIDAARSLYAQKLVRMQADRAIAAGQEVLLLRTKAEVGQAVEAQALAADSRWARAGVLEGSCAQCGSEARKWLESTRAGAGALAALAWAAATRGWWR
jgi:hypothetical protein